MLRAIRMTNVRRFTAPVVVDGIGPGLNLLAAPNEAGKSTLFAALHAAFFKRAKSWDATVKALQPHAGGDPQVAVDLDTADGPVTIAKTWSERPGRKSARILSGDRLIAQEDAAEAWIADWLAAPGGPGPAGLLWVRQGDSGFDPKDASSQTARRDLISSVAGEITTLTAGRGAEKIIAAAREDLGRYVGKRGTALKDGPLGRAEAEVAALSDRRAKEAALRDALQSDLAARRDRRTDLARVTAPEAAADLKARLDQAEDAMAAADRHAASVATAQADRDAAASAHQAAAGRLTALRRAMDERRDAQAALTKAIADEAEATQKAEAADAAANAAEADRDTAEDTAEAAEAALDHATRLIAARDAAARRADLADRLTHAEAQESAVAAAEAAAARGPDADTMAELEALNDSLRLALATRDRAAPSVEIAYGEGAEGRIRRDGDAVPGDTRLPLPSGAVFEIDGVGRLTLHPGAATRESDVAAARDALTEALSAKGHATLDAARQAARRRSDAAARRDHLKADFAARHPDGLQPLRDQIAALPEAGIDTDAPDPDTARAARDTATAPLPGLRGAARAAREDADGAARALSAVAATRQAAEARADRAMSALSDHQDPDAALQIAQTDAAAWADRTRQAEDALAQMTRDAPDAEAARTRLTRLQKAKAEAAGNANTLREEIARLDGKISSSAADGIEDVLADTEAQLSTAQARLDAVRREVQVLSRLIGALEDARAQAKDRYLAPVMAEIGPLLEMILPGAGLSLDDDALLPSDLTRDGMAEPVDILSGGTQEQIALMVRLAFAKMLAKAGKPAPVILDDAIVFTDDDRIERIFDALNRQGEAVQIIVLTCRQRAFRDLGARQLRIAPKGAT